MIALRQLSGMMPDKPAGFVRLLLIGWLMLAVLAARGDEAAPTKAPAATKAGTNWWSLQPIRRPAAPSVKNPNWVQTPIDAFVLAPLDANGLKPSPPALAHQLIRRLAFDLTGLPPEPQQVSAFTRAYEVDPDQAVGELVDRLLASPQYGERWARHWLDVARFGESDGYEYDKLRPNAWPYRDWVIRALNDDLPYDRFAQLQIAGDLLEPSNAGAVAATGFLVGGAFDGLLPQGDKMRKIMREDEMEDLVGTVSQTFLGLTVHCARCHDHKFDPVSQREYYQMASALAGVHRGDRDLPPEGDPETLRRRIAELNSLVAQLEKPIRQQLTAKANPSSGAQGNPPQPIAFWTFDQDLRDELGKLHGAPKGGARIEGGALWLDGKSAYVATAPLDRPLKAKTLAAWIKLADLDQSGGAPLSVQTTDGNRFDAIVFGEREPKRWMAGSEGYMRTQSFAGPEESSAATEFVQVAIVYRENGSIIAYRNGEPYGKSYQVPAPATFEAGAAQVMFGLRHGTEATAGRMFAGWIDRAALYDRALTPAEVATSAKVSFFNETQLVASLSINQRNQRNSWRDEIAKRQSELERMLSRKAYAVTPKDAGVTHLLIRGSPFQPGESVAAAGVAAIHGLASTFGVAPDAPEGERRIALAKWITSPDNPLFARVMVNRVWHHHFGQGLVKTPNDLGFNGGEASHPELLDWLADEFRASGWSLKRLHRLVTTSATYRQATTPNAVALRLDADNRLLWRHTPRRIEAEALRDAVLYVAGKLEASVGGEGYRDFHMHLHKGSWVYDSIDPTGPEFNRRSIYRTWARGSQHPLLTTFDCPDPSTTTPVRGVTTTPLGSLSLMNTSFTLRMADHFAERLNTEVGSEPTKQIARAYQLAFGRDPKPGELALSIEFVRANDLAAFCRVLFNANEFLYLN